MNFKFSPEPGFNFLKSFAAKLNIKVHGNTLTIPDNLGKGKIRFIDLTPDFRLTIHRYKLKEEFILKRVAPKVQHDMIKS